MPRTRLTVPNDVGDALDAVLTSPDQPPQAFALYLHCFTCTKEIAAAVRIANELAEHGVATLRFDFSGLGKSEGDFSETNFSTNVSDVLRVAAMMADRFEAPRLIIGHSLGGAAALASACKLPSVAAVATIGAPADPAHIQKLFEDEIERIRREGEAQVSLAGRPFKITRQFVDDAATYDLAARLPELDAALLILHAPEDRLVSIDEAAKIYMKARHPKSFVSLSGADHLLTGKQDAAYAAKVIAAWASRYLAQ